MAHVKDTYYFAHDCNARNDPKILALRSVYGSEGYGWYWIIIEMMREQPEYKLECSKKFSLIAISKELGCSEEKAQEFINDCVEQFELFVNEGGYIWSNSLKKRMMRLNEIRASKSNAAKKRWDKPQPEKKEEAHFLDDDDEAEELVMNDKEVDKAFKAFEVMRNKIKKPLTTRARTMAINKLIKLAGDNTSLAVQILDKSTFHDWQDLYELSEGLKKETVEKRVVKL